MQIQGKDGTVEDVGPLAARQIADLRERLWEACDSKRTWRLAFFAVLVVLCGHMMGHLS